MRNKVLFVTAVIVAGLIGTWYTFPSGENCTCQQICGESNYCVQGKCPAECRLELQRRFNACCTLTTSDGTRWCCVVEIEQFECASPTAVPIPIDGEILPAAAYTGSSSGCSGEVLVKKKVRVEDWV